jgi:hypothetical protein
MPLVLIHRRNCHLISHLTKKIDLMPGVQPVNVKPYWYSPQQKDEMEKQIREMLKQGIIRTSHNPFASPVLLGKKKDDTWRFCVGLSSP